MAIDPCPGARISSHHSGNLNSSDVEEYPHIVKGGPEEICNRPHMVTGIREEIPFCSLELRQENKRRLALHISHNFVVKTPLRPFRQTRFCWTFNKWRRIVIQPISTTTTSTESRNCPKPSQRQCPLLTGNQRNSNCLKICCKQLWNSTTNWQKKTKQTISTLSSVVTHYKPSKPLHQPQEREFGRYSDCVP